ncbi:hypothetical protein BH24ACT19_BH24ACT19_20520 [soil metagenome]
MGRLRPERPDQAELIECGWPEPVNEAPYVSDGLLGLGGDLL